MVDLFCFGISIISISKKYGHGSSSNEPQRGVVPLHKDFNKAWFPINCNDCSSPLAKLVSWS